MPYRYTLVKEIGTRCLAFFLGAFVAVVALYHQDLAESCTRVRQSVVLLDYVNGRCYTVWAADGAIKHHEVPCEEDKTDG